ncbi:hypothetical protein ACFXPY_29325, partial [Streptomyces sp. NPDC059153]
LSSSGVRFEVPGAKYGAFQWKGDLQDTSAGDGHNVCVQVKAEGYSWNRCNGNVRRRRPVHQRRLDTCLP